MKTFNDKICYIYEKPYEQESHNPQKKNAILNRFAYAEHYVKGNKVIVKKFNPGSYNGPTKQDFIERLNIIFEAALKIIQKSPVDRHPERIAALRKKKAIAIKDLRQDCKVPACEISSLLAQEKNTTAIIKKAQQHIGQFIHAAAEIIDPHQKKNKIIADIEAMESEITTKKGRPNFINYYQLPAPYNHRQHIHRVSIQRVVGTPLPSTNRDTPSLANFVQCGIGYMEGNNYISQFEGYRHSSYPPIKIEDKEHRTAETKKTVTQMLKEIATQELAKIKSSTEKYDQSKVIPLPLSTLTLLSPINGDQFILKKESEYQQLEESRDMLMSFNKETIELTLADGSTVKVRPEITLVNASANWHGMLVSKTKLLRSTLETTINKQGMVTFAQQAKKFVSKNIHALHDDKFIKEIGDTLLSLMPKEEITTYAAIKKSMTANRDEIKDLLAKIVAHKEKEFKNPKFKQKKDLLDLAELYLQTMMIEIDRQIEPSQFGARYLLANKIMGNYVEFFCKSGEDRTGRMQNLLEELLEFYRRHQRYPQYDVKTRQIAKIDAEEQVTIAKYVAEFSVCRDIADQNAHGARGLQLTSGPLLNQGLPNLSGDTLGKLAKGVYQDARNCPNSASTPRAICTLTMFRPNPTPINPAPSQNDQVANIEDILRERHFNQNEAMRLSYEKTSATTYSCTLFQDTIEAEKLHKKLLLDATEECVRLHKPFLKLPEEQMSKETKAKLILATLNISESSTSIPPIYIVNNKNKDSLLVKAIKAEHKRLSERLSNANASTPKID